MRNNKKIIAGLDVGTNNTTCLIAIHSEAGIEIIGSAAVESHGILNGEVINPDVTCETIQTVVAAAQDMAGCMIKNVIVGLSGRSIHGINSNGMVPLRQGEVTEKSLADVIEAASAIPEIRERSIVHVVPQIYEVDYKAVNRFPIGVTGVRLDAKVHVVSASRDSYNNICKCVTDCGLTVQKVVADQVASSYAVLTKEEKNLGVAVVDFGAGSTDLAIYVEGALVHTESIKFAGNYLTEEVSKKMACLFDEAEGLKTTKAELMLSRNKSKQTLRIGTVGHRPQRIVGTETLSKLVQLHVAAILEMVWDAIFKSGYSEDLRAGIVITGGSSQFEHLPKLAEIVLKNYIRDVYPHSQVTEVPVRRGAPPRKISGLIDVVENPTYATNLGLILYGVENDDFCLEEVRGRDRGFVERFCSKFRDIFAG